MKYCPRCEEEKELSAFYITKTTGNASSYCRMCRSDYARDRYRNDEIYRNTIQQASKERAESERNRKSVERRLSIE